MESIPKENQLKVEPPKPQGAQTSLSTYIYAIRTSSTYKPLHLTTSAAKICRIANPKPL
jgi:hypothetical protein